MNKRFRTLFDEEASFLFHQKWSKGWWFSEEGSSKYSFECSLGSAFSWWLSKRFISEKHSPHWGSEPHCWNTSRSHFAPFRLDISMSLEVIELQIQTNMDPLSWFSWLANIPLVYFQRAFQIKPLQVGQMSQVLEGNLRLRVLQPLRQ